MPTVESILLEKGSDVVGVGRDVTVREAVAKMIEANVGCLIVEEDAKVVGIFTERDLLRRVIGDDKDPNSTPISEVMSHPVRSCTPTDDVDECFDILFPNQYRHLLVVDKDEPVGVISLRDLAFVLHKAG